ncbi:hypothetical protein [Fodinicola acaciae]|uniref:hypothetical protein n=1 Tax=Fodinicola acaciae TaxID=2681555 RepID=UPI0013D6AF33|nr:hypothetical protein [Fodinicola acaciae]
MPKVIVPVGFDGGPFWSMEPGEHPQYCRVLLGDQTMHLPEDAYLVWGTAMLDQPAHAESRFTKADLVRLSSDDSRIVDPEGTVDRLSNAGLLVEFDPEDALTFLRSYKLYLLAEGSGNSKERPESFRLSRRGEVVLELYYDAYAILEGMPYAANMWDEIQDYVKTLPSEGTFSLEQLTLMFASAVPALVASRCGYLQPS